MIFGGKDGNYFLVLGAKDGLSANSFREKDVKSNHVLQEK